MTAKIEWSREAIQAAWKAFNVASENPMKNALNAACEIQGIECLRAENEKLRDGVRSTIQERDILSGENWELHAENEKLRAALKPFEKEAEGCAYYDLADYDIWQVPVAMIRAAADALKETGDE